jgi:hypothetical protein
MPLLANILAAGLLLAAVARPHAVPSLPLVDSAGKRQANSDPTVVDLGYSVYQGVTNDTLNQIWWKG